MQPRIEQIPIETISYGATQTRVSLKEETIESYRPPAKLGILPPIIVYRESEANGCFLGDGHMRREAHVREGLKMIKAEIRFGGLREAKLCAAGANEDHGERRTNDDKIKSVKMLLEDDEWKNNSDRWIADVCKVSHTFVAKIRNSGQSGGQSASTGNVASARNETSSNSQNNTTSGRRGRDGRKMPASQPKPILCARCERVGAIPDCPGCADARKKAGIGPGGKKKKKPKKKPQPREELVDMVGNTVPDRCRDAYADPSLSDFIENLEGIEAMFDPQNAVDKMTKLCDHYGFILLGKFSEHIFQAKESIQLAIESLKVGKLHAVCPKCNAAPSNGDGKCCKGCRGFGMVPLHRYEELTAK